MSFVSFCFGNLPTGDDGISAEVIKAAGEKGVDIIHKRCKQIWNSDVIPKDWGKVVIVPIFKKKDKMDLANYRGISLLSLAGKVFCTIIQTRIQKKIEETLSEYPRQASEPAEVLWTIST